MVLKNKNNLKIKPLNFKPQEKSITNTIIGHIRGPVNTDDSIKINGGSVLISGNNQRVSNKNVLTPQVRNRNRETLVRTIF